MPTPYRLALIAALARRESDPPDRTGQNPRPPRDGGAAAAPAYDCDHAHRGVGAHEAIEAEPGELPTLALDAAALVIVGALRAWVAPVLHPGRDHPAWQDVFSLARLPASAAAAFDRALRLIAARAIRSIDVRCPSCPAVSADERLLVAVVSALQRDLTVLGHRVLCDWLREGDAAEAVSALSHLAAALRGAGLVAAEDLPGRPHARAGVLH